jgi:hypothetical protein
MSKKEHYCFWAAFELYNGFLTIISSLSCFAGIS